VSDVQTAIKSELAKPEVQAKLRDVVGDVVAVSGFIMEIVEAVIFAQFPPFLRPVISALVGPLLQDGINDIKALEAKALGGLIPVINVPLATSSLALHVTAKVWPKDLPEGPCETQPAWPGCKE
jgi:hypothetical protein